MEYTEIILTRKEGIAWLSLNRPSKMNALTPTMMKEWRTILTDLSKDKTCKVIVVKGEGRAWSAGVDLSLFQEIEVAPGNSMYDDGMEVIRLLEYMPQATIAMVNGFCFTGALELMLAFDFAIGADECKIGDTHAKWGIPPKWGLTQRLQRVVGLRRAKQMSFSTVALSGKQAERIGLLNESHPLEILEDRVREIALQIAGNSAQSVASIKEIYQYGAERTFLEGLAFETDYQIDITDKEEELREFKKRM